MKTPATAPKWIFCGTVVVLSAALGARFVSQDKRMFAPDTSTAGHYQIEQRCGVCHRPFRGVSNDACLKCHAEELQKANDSHAPGKFADPRNAASLAVLDARECRTCHHEHRPEVTRAGGVTQPADHCYACHTDIAKERPSHARFDAQGCAATGCHKYHDNTALYEDFLVRHLRDPDTVRVPRVVIRTSAKPRAVTAPDAGSELNVTAEIQHQWQSTAHARAGVNCSGCHTLTNQPTARAVWVLKPGPEFCAGCHANEAAGFKKGRHGMRVAQQLSPMSPQFARQAMKHDAAHKHLGCSSCHAAHDFETRRAAAESCLTCHNDQHSLAYKNSPHFQLWQKELAGTGATGSGVSCATCHLPREQTVIAGVECVVVQHNQNANLRPNEKMIRSVCLDCHGFGFSAAALADVRLLQNNFNGCPSQPNESIVMAARRLAEDRQQPK